MVKKRKPTNPSAGKQSREQLLNQKNGGVPVKKQPSDGNVPGSSNGTSSMPVNQIPNTRAVEPQPRPTAAPTCGPVPTQSSTASAAAAANQPSCATHAQTAPSLPSPNGPLPAPPTVNSWMQVFKMLPAERQAWFDATPGAETTYTMIIENAKRKHAQSVADKAKAAQQGGVVGGGVEPQTVAGSSQPQSNGPIASTAPAVVAQQGPSRAACSSAGPSRAALPAFTSPIPIANGLSVPQNIPARPASTPVIGSAPSHLPAPHLPVPPATSASAFTYGPPITTQGLALELERLRSENLQIKTLMAGIKGALDSECARRGLQPLDIIPSYLGGNGKTTPEEAARMQLGAPVKSDPVHDSIARSGKPPVQTAVKPTNGPTTQALRDLQASKDAEELAMLRTHLDVNTGALEDMATQILSLRADLETARKENTRLGLNCFKDKAEREGLLRDKARLEAEVQQLREELKGGDKRVVEVEEETRHLQEQAESSKRDADLSRHIIQSGEKERKRLKVRLDAIKLLVLQDDVDDLDPLDLGRQLMGLGNGAQPAAETNIRYLTNEDGEQSVSSLPALPDSLSSSIGSLAESDKQASSDTAQPSDPALDIATRWSRTVKDRARSQESLKLLKVAWKLAALERVVMKSAGTVRETALEPTEKESVSEDVEPGTNLGVEDADTLASPPSAQTEENMTAVGELEGKVVEAEKQEEDVGLSTESVNPSGLDLKVSKVEESEEKMTLNPSQEPPVEASGRVPSPSGQAAAVDESKEDAMSDTVAAVSVEAVADGKPPVVSTRSELRETSPAMAPSLKPSRVEVKESMEPQTPEQPSWSPANQVLVAQSDDDNDNDSSSSDNDNPDVVRLLTRIPHLIEYVKLGRLSEEGISSLRKLMKMKRSAIVRWHKKRGLPSPYDDLPACLQADLSDTSLDSSSEVGEEEPEMATNKAAHALPHAEIVPAAKNIAVAPTEAYQGQNSEMRTGEHSAMSMTEQLDSTARRGEYVEQDWVPTLPSTTSPTLTSNVNRDKAQRDNIIRAIMMRMVSERLQINKIRQKRRIAATTYHMRQSRKAFLPIDLSESDVTAESDTSDYSDIEADKEIFGHNSLSTVGDKKEAAQNSLLNLPDEIIDEIVFYLKPRYAPREETYGAMRIVTWEQDAVFDPCWGEDLFGLATSAKRFYNTLYDKYRLKCIQVVDSEAGIKSMVKSIPDDKKRLVRTVIIGNNLRVDDSISPPAYLDLLDVFPRLTALQHRAWAPSVSAKLLAEPFDFTPLEALDLFVPDTLCDLAGPPPPSWPRSQVKSLTLREYRWWMLYTEVSFASPDPNESAMYFDYLCKHFKGIKQLNLSPQLIADVDPVICTLEKVGERTRSWMTRENLPEVERVNIRFDAAYKVRQEDICALPRIEYMLTDLSRTLRHIRIAVDLRHPDATRLFLDTLHPALSPRETTEYWGIITQHYIPSPARIKEFARTLARYMMALETVQFAIYNHDSAERPMFQYDAKVVRVRKSELAAGGRPGSFRLLEKTWDRLAELVAQNQ